MALANVYSQVNGQIPAFFDKIREGQAPDKFTQQHLKDIGFASTNHRAFIPLLKALNFLNSEGTPTSRYHEYRDGSQSKKILGDALKEAYSDLFVINAHPKASDKALIEGKFKSTFNTSDRPADLMAKTFLALLAIADIDHTKPKLMPEATQGNTQTSTQSLPVIPSKTDTHLSTSLNYNIQIHLPATKDIEVYNAIFKAVKEHLIG